MHKYIHQGRMLPSTFSGKILVSHPVGYSILSSDVTTAVASNYPGAQISFDKFGISKLIKVGVLCGTLKHESRQALTSHLEAALSQQKNTCNIPVRVTWESIYVNGENPSSVEAIFIKCRIEDVACATVVLSCLYGSIAAERDPLHPLVRFIPMATLKSSEPVTLQVIARQHQFLNSTYSTTLKNTRPLESQIKIPYSAKTITLAALLQSIKDSQGATLFHTVAYNMNRTNQILLASTLSNADHIKAIQKDTMTFLHTSYPWLMASDIFEQLDATTALMKQIKDLHVTQVAQAGKIIEDLFLDWEGYPSLSEEGVAGPAPQVNTTSRVQDSGVWKLGAPPSHHKPQHTSSKRTVHLTKKAKASTTEVFSDSELSNSVDSYSTRRSRRRSAKFSQVPATTSPPAALAQPVHPPEACLLPLAPQHRAMASLTTATTDQSSLTNTIGDQLVMIQQQSLELDELKAHMHLVCQDMLQYQATQVNMAQNLHALHSTVQEVANAMASMTLKLNQFCFPAALSLPASTSPTPHESPTQPSEASMGWSPP